MQYRNRRCAGGDDSLHRARATMIINRLVAPEMRAWSYQRVRCSGLVYRGSKSTVPPKAATVSGGIDTW
eukprot:14004848-Alexandrium_andersonii.AAC.1